MKCREMAARERSMQLTHLQTIMGADDARLLEAVDPMEYEFGRGVTLEGLIALAEMRDEEWARRDEA